MNRTCRLLLAFQSLYYITTGLWPLVSIGTFQAVTGPKTDLWLVKLVGLLVITIGATIGLHLLRARQATGVLVFLSLASIAAFAGTDIVYSLSGTISTIYLADALLELVLALAIAVSYFFVPGKRG